MPLTDRTQRKQDAKASFLQPALIGMTHDAGVHQGRGGIAIFVTEIGANQLLPLVANPFQRQIEKGANLFEPVEEDLARLPVALFPQKIGGQYMMLGRQDGQNMFLLKSDDLTQWDGGDLLMGPKYAWEFIQIGNCGAPILVDEGWLVLTHGVGAMRQYALGAVLLDRDDPSKIVGRTRYPILEAEDDDRNGYVPNVVYTCGGMRIGDQLFMPYGISDSSIGFAFLPLKDLVAALS